MPKERFKLIPAVYLVLRRDNQVLLLRRISTEYQDEKYGLIAGHADGDELMRDAMVREAKEEAGITITPDDLSFVHISHRLTRNQPGQERIDLFFECNKWQDEITNMEPSKCSDLTWFPVDDLPTETIPFVRLVLENIQKSVNYSEFSVEPD